MNNKYFLLRHGQNFYQADFPDMVYPCPEPLPILLTDRGKKEATKAAKELKKMKIEIIFSSDLPRTRQTAEIVGKETGNNIILDIRLRDTNFGIFGGKRKNEYINFFSNEQEKFLKNPPQGESWQDVKKRVKDFIKEIEEKYQNKRILIVSHGDPLRILESLLKNIKNESEILSIKYLKTGEIKEI